MANCLLTLMVMLTALWAVWGNASLALWGVVMLLCNSVLESAHCVLTLEVHTVTSTSSAIPLSTEFATGDWVKGMGIDLLLNITLSLSFIVPPTRHILGGVYIVPRHSLSSCCHHLVAEFCTPSSPIHELL